MKSVKVLLSLSLMSLALVVLGGGSCGYAKCEEIKGTTAESEKTCNDHTTLEINGCKWTADTADAKKGTCVKNACHATAKDDAACKASGSACKFTAAVPVAPSCGALATADATACAALTDTTACTANNKCKWNTGSAGTSTCKL